MLRSGLREGGVRVRLGWEARLGLCPRPALLLLSTTHPSLHLHLLTRRGRISTSLRVRACFFQLSRRKMATQRFHLSPHLCNSVPQTLILLLQPLDLTSWRFFPHFSFMLLWRYLPTTHTQGE